MPEDLLVPISLHALAMLYRWARRCPPVGGMLAQYTPHDLKVMALTAAWEAQTLADCTRDCWAKLTVRLLRRRLREEQPERLLQSSRFPVRRPDLSQYTEGLADTFELPPETLSVLASHLPPKTCGLLYAVYIEQKSIKELAVQNNTTPDALWMALSRARHKARSVLEQLEYAA